MPEWLIWMAAFWFFFGVVGRRGCGWGGYGRMHRGWERRGMISPSDDVRLRTPAPPRVQRPQPAPRRETAEQRLQREFVEGRLSIEQYEDALWRELGPRHRA